MSAEGFNTDSNRPRRNQYPRQVYLNADLKSIELFNAPSSVMRDKAIFTRTRCPHANRTHANHGRNAQRPRSVDTVFPTTGKCRKS